MDSPRRIDGQGYGGGWRFTASLGLVTMAGAAARVALLDQVMRNDEVVTASRFAVDLGTAVTNYSAPNNHILHSILVNLSASVFGLEPWAVRLPALLFGLGLIVAVDWWIFSATGKRAAGLLAAALVAGSSLVIEYSTIARGYTMVAVGFVVLMEISRRLLSNPTLRLWIGWVLVAVAGLVTVPVFVFPLSVVGMWLFFNVIAGRSRQQIRSLWAMAFAVSAVGALTALAYLPAAISTGVASIVDNPFIQSIAWSDLPGHWYRLTANLTVLVWRDGIIAVGYSALFIAAIVRNRAIFGRVLTPAIGLVGPLTIVSARMVAPPQRVWLFLWPLVLGLAGAAGAFLLERGFPRLTADHWILAIALSLAATMGLGTLASGDVTESRESGPFRDGPAVAELLKAELGEGDRVLVESHPRIVLDWYLSPEEPSDWVIHRVYENADRIFVVVFYPREQDLNGMLDGSSVPVAEFSEPTLLWDLPKTDVYVMERTG
jgi:hypothetical protein